MRLGTLGMKRVAQKLSASWYFGDERDGQEISARWYFAKWAHTDQRMRRVDSNVRRGGLWTIRWSDELTYCAL